MSATFDPAPVPDTSPPSFSVAAKKPKLGKALNVTLKVKVGCDEDCTVVGRGNVVVTGGKLSAIAAKKKKSKFKLGKEEANLAAGDSTTLKLKPKNKKTKKKLKKALKKSGKGKAKIKLTATDAAGNKSKDKLSVKLKK